MRGRSGARCGGSRGAHDRESQLALLRTLHGWAVEAAAEIRAVYGPGLPVEVSRLPSDDAEAAAFTVRVGAGTIR
jgi:hypothetical protein